MFKLFYNSAWYFFRFSKLNSKSGQIKLQKKEIQNIWNMLNKKSKNFFYKKDDGQKKKDLSWMISLEFLWEYTMIVCTRIRQGAQVHNKNKNLQLHLVCCHFIYLVLLAACLWPDTVFGFLLEYIRVLLYLYMWWFLSNLFGDILILNWW